MADITKRYTGSASGELKDVRLRRTPRKPNEPQGTSTNTPPSTTVTKTAGNNTAATITANNARPVSTTSPAPKTSPATTPPSATTTEPELKPVTKNATVNSNRPTMTSTETSANSAPAPAATAPPTAPTPSPHRPDNVSDNAEQSMRKTEFYEEEVQHFAEVDVKSFSIPQRPSQPSADRVEPGELRCRSKPQSAPKPTQQTSKSSSVNAIFVLLTAVVAAAIGWLGYEEILPAVYVVPGISISVGMLVMLLVWSALH